MAKTYEELEVCQSALGRLILRLRRPPGLDAEVYEIMLDDDLLMSSYLNESELQLARIALDAMPEGSFDIIVGGLGLGYTAAAALAHERARTVTIIELLPEIIQWHQDGRVPLGLALTRDPRCTIRNADFFAAVGDPAPDIACEGGYGAIIVDIDHAPDSWLSDAHQRFYAGGALANAAGLLAPGGVFGFWSAGEPNEPFLELLRGAFATVKTTAVEVYNPMIDEDQVDTIYVASRE